jgi:hypothetical protein
MPLPAGDMLSGFMEGLAKGFRVLAGKKAIAESKGQVKTEDLTDEEWDQARTIRDAQLKKAIK